MRKIIFIIIIVSCFLFFVQGESDFQSEVETFSKQVSGSEILGPFALLFGNERINIEVTLVSNTKVTVGLITENNAIIKIASGGIEEPTLLVFTDETTLRAVVESDNSLQALQRAIKEEKIKYKAVGLGKKIKFKLASTLLKLRSFFICSNDSNAFFQRMMRCPELSHISEPQSTAAQCQLQTAYTDNDGDGSAGTVQEICVNGAILPEYSLTAIDCNDTNPQIYPAAMETCDGLDNNCNQQLDENLAGCCAGRVVDLQTNLQHCGSCGHPCPGTSRCLRGQCVSEVNSIYVDVQGDDSNAGTPEAPLHTIQVAINKVKEGGTVHLGEGRFNQQVVVNKTVLLIGAGPDKTFIAKSAGRANPVVIVENAEDVHLYRFSISGSETSSGTTEQGLYAENSDIIVEQVNFYSIINYYISIYKSSFALLNVSLRQHELRGFISNADLGVSMGDSQGTIDYLVAPDGNIDHVIDRRSTFPKAVRGEVRQINVNDSKNLIVKNSIITGRNFNWGEGIRFYGSGGNRLTLENNHFQGYPNVQFPQLRSDGTFAQQAPHAIAVAGVDVIMINNSITNFPTAVFIQGSSNTLPTGSHNVFNATHNTITNNGLGILTLRGSGYVKDFGGTSPGGNIFENNTVFDIYNTDNSNTLLAKNNRWGTEDAQQISRRIFDRNDDPLFGSVEYIPLG